MAISREELIRVNKEALEIIKERKLAEYWAKVASYIPTEPVGKTAAQLAFEVARNKRAADRLIFNQAIASGKTAIELEQLGLEVNFKVVWEVKPAQVNVEVHKTYRKAFIARHS
jgi:hypothetical protein